MYIRRNPAKTRFAERLDAYRQKVAQMKLMQAEVEKAPRGTSIEGLFLGPKAENQELFRNLINEAVVNHCAYRRDYFPNDPISITDEMKDSENYHVTVNGVRGLQSEYAKLLKCLEGTPPFHSYRWQGHMNGDLTMPGMLGYFAGMLYNPNNVAAEASPTTTMLEIEVGDQLCNMLGYSTDRSQPGAVSAWGHITCDGSVANLEAMWAARNMKYYAVALANAVRHEPAFAPAQGVTVTQLNGTSARLTDLDNWTLLNLKSDDVLQLPEAIKQLLGKRPSSLGDEQQEDNARIDSLFNEVMDSYNVQRLGMLEFYRKFLPDTATPVVLGPVSMHYSWPKSAAVVGIGAEHILGVHVNLDCRMRMDHLKELLDDCLANRRPVMLTVAVIGSTEESAVDPLVEILQLREYYRSHGLDFMVHADAAWGGYFASMIRDPDEPVLPYRSSTPALPLSQYVTDQYDALSRTDSITIDPHKAGFLPYPSGGLCYRNSSLRNIVSFTAPVVYHGGVDPTVGVYGIEGSKPGAAAAGVYLSHRVLGTDKDGYGQLLGKAIFNSKRFYAALVTMVQEDDPFFVVPVQRLPAERDGGDTVEQLNRIREWLGATRANCDIESNADAMALLKELGSDHNIVPYMFGIKPRAGQRATLDQVNRLNQKVFDLLSVAPDRDDLSDIPLIVTSSQFQIAAYGEEFMSSIFQRLGVDAEVADPDLAVDFIISTTTTPFVTDTFASDGYPMLYTVIEGLRSTVHKAFDMVMSEQERGA